MANKWWMMGYAKQVGSKQLKICLFELFLKITECLKIWVQHQQTFEGMNLSLQQEKKQPEGQYTEAIFDYVFFIHSGCEECGTVGRAQEKTWDSGVAIPLSSCTLDKHSVRPHCPHPWSEEWDRSP